MGNEVSRPTEDLSPQSSGAVPPRSPFTPTGGSSHRAQSFNARSPPPSMAASGNAPPPQRRTSSSSSLGSNPTSNPTSNPKKERTIQRMDKAIRRRVRGGITYNMKLLIRGAKGTGKTSLLQRLKGEPIPETHQSTPQLQSATIKWSFRQNLEENVKCEVWDVVDQGFVPVEAEDGGDEGSNGPQRAAPGVGAEYGGLQGGGSLSAEATAAAAAAAMQNGTHSVAFVDASTVDVYHEAHGVIFLLDVTKWDTLEYVKQQLDSVPVHIPTLVLGNFRDHGAQRKIFKEDIQELLYGSSDRPQHQQWRRPMDLLYFECSLLNCYGLKSLHQYFGIPFLQLKLATIRQQMRIVEGEFAHLKHDVQATISEQRYAEYVEHIKSTGSDIRTGRRGSGSESTPRAVSRSNSVRLSTQESSPAKQASADDDVSVVGKENGVGTPTSPAAAESTPATVAETSQQEQQMNQSQDIEDLPARYSSVAIQAATPLKFEHKESVASISDDVPEDIASEIEGKAALSEGQRSEIPAVSIASPRRPRKASMEEVMHLEDFQVPKTRAGDLERFYSEDESDEDIGEYDEDVVVAPVDGSMKASIGGVYHKQRFIDSDSSDSDDSESAVAQRRRKKKVPREISPRRTATKQASTSGQTVHRPPQSSPSPHPPGSASQPNQRSRPVSPARSQSSSPVKDGQVPRGVSPEEREASSPTGGMVSIVTPTPPPVPPTSPSALSIRHSSPRNKCENSDMRAHSEARVSQQRSPSQAQEEVLEHYHKRNVDEAGELLSLSTLQESLPLTGEAAAALPFTMPDTVDTPMGNSNESNASRTNEALHLSDLQTSSSMAAASKPVVFDFAAVVPSNDLEAFLNESDSDLENAPPPGYGEPAAGFKQSSKQGKQRMVESSDDDDDEEDEDRFASYSINKKSRTERRRQQKEDLRQLNVALDMENDAFTPSTSGVVVSDSSFGTSDVMEAIRKAQEEAMCMLPTEPISAEDDVDLSSSKNKHKHKHKHKHKKEDGFKEKSLKKSSRKAGSSSRSKKRRPRVEDDLM
ncbi:hypothetical protein PHYPSEUDO_006802 [Phytophthora pseudosyringae]|uniref:GTP-binding protein Parf n=1 Tax=Phytophthora pseudosyringae TaxID=221518 RepID=A0A8T1VKM4_9STRA|nr:hypothetical protein PHYPSEUDO_006802 [Phytophthora pseudosyringae]